MTDLDEVGGEEEEVAVPEGVVRNLGFPADVAGATGGFAVFGDVAADICMRRQSGRKVMSNVDVSDDRVEGGRGTGEQTYLHK